MTQTMTAPAEDRSNRLSLTRAGGQLVTDYWDDLFTAHEVRPMATIACG